MKELKQRKFWLEHYHDKKYEDVRLKITEAFKNLVFDEEPHKYYLDGVELECVSNVTHMFKPEFDPKIEAQRTYERNYDNEASKYYRMTAEQIYESWQKIQRKACTTGSDRHNFGESVFWWMVGEYGKIAPEFRDRFTVCDGEDNKCTAKYPKEEAILSFWNDLPDCYMPILAENKVFNVNDIYAYSGTFDILFYYDAELNGKSDKASGVQIYDYKTNADLYKNFKGETLMPPFEHLLNMPESLYKLQLAAYQLCLERIGLNVIARRLIWLKPDSAYEKIPIEDLTKPLDLALTERFKKK